VYKIKQLMKYENITSPIKLMKNQ